MSSGASRSAISMSRSASSAVKTRAVVGAEGVGIVAQERARALRRIGGVQRLGEIVVEGADDGADPRLDLVLRRVRPLAGIASDDELDARQMRQREVGKEGGDAAVVKLGQRRADPLAQIGGVAVARHEDEDRDEAVEAVAARERADARPLLQLQDRDRRFVERLARPPGTARCADNAPGC